MEADLKKREQWQARFAALGGLAVISIVGVPAGIVVLSPALTTVTEEWVPIGSIESFPAGRTVPVEVGGGGAAGARQIYIRRDGDGGLVVFSRRCTDLSCPVAWDDGSACFFCPCHGGIFDREGEPMAGPPARGLYRYAVRIRDDLVEIDLRSVPPMG